MSLLTRVNRKGNLFSETPFFNSTSTSDNQQKSSNNCCSHADHQPSQTDSKNNCCTESSKNQDDDETHQRNFLVSQQLQVLDAAVDATSGHHHHHHHGKECVRCYTHPPVDESLVQTLEEVAFDNGIWALLSRGSPTNRIREFLNRHQSGGGITNANNISSSSSSSSPWSYWCTKKCPSGYSPLLYAVRQGNLESVELLIEHGANAREEVTPESRMSALHRAAAMGHYDVCVLLLRKGADRSQKDSRGLTAHDWVEQNLYSSAKCDDDDKGEDASNGRSDTERLCDSAEDQAKKMKREKMLQLLAPN